MKTTNRITPITLVATIILIIACNKEQKDLPVASFLCPNTVGIWDTIYFYNTSEGANTYDWDFGDGNVSTEENPSHIYTEPGVFTILLVATNEDGSDEASWDILIKPWGTRAPMPTARFWFSCEVVNGKIYVIGGATKSSAPTLAKVEVYDPATDSWDTTKTDMPTARCLIASTNVDGKIYIVGGDRYFQAHTTNGVRTLEVYNTANDTWDTSRTDMPTARSAASACTINGIIYVIGGVKPGGTITGIVEAYDPVTDTWIKKTGMPARASLSTSVVDGKIYAIGGQYVSGQACSTVKVYDPAMDTWSQKSPMLSINCYFGTGVVDGIIYTVGGVSAPGSPYSQVFAYDPSSDEWSEITAMPTARMGLGAGVVNEKIYAMGGAPIYTGPPLSTNEVLYLQ